MPAYQYHCDKCDEKHEVWCIPSKRHKQVCPNCETQMKMLFGAPLRVWKCDKGGQP